MNIQSIPLDTLSSTEQSLKQIANKSSVASPDVKTRASAHKVATEFEAMFAGMMLKSMRSSAMPDKLTGGGRGEEIFQSMLDQEYASAIARQGSLGIAQTIEKQLLDDAHRQAASATRHNPAGKP